VSFGDVSVWGCVCWSYVFISRIFISTLYIAWGGSRSGLYSSEVAHDGKIIKRCAVAGYGITPAYHFRVPYVMVHNIRENDTSNGNDITLDDRHSSYSQLSTVLHEALAGYENLIAYGTAKCSFLSS